MKKHTPFFYLISIFLLLFPYSSVFSEPIVSVFSLDQKTTKTSKHIPNTPLRLQRQAKNSTQASSTVEDIKRNINDPNPINYFKLAIDQALSIDASIDYQTKDGTAIAGQDYIAKSGTITIDAGTTSVLIPITIISDTLVESSESFFLTITNPVGAKFPEGISEISVQHTIVDSFDSSSGGSVSNTTNITGAVIDGEISGATVFLDLNRNGTLDSDEPTASTSNDGTYTLVLSAAHQAHSNYQNKKAPLVVYGGTDIRTGEPFQDYLSAIVEDTNSANITPLTTLIEQTVGEEIDQGTIATLNDMQTKMDEIKTNLASLLDIQKDLLSKNPITLATAGDTSLINGALQLHKAAKAMKKAMRKEVRGLQKSILKTYRSLGKQLKSLQKSAIKSGDTALTTALDSALDDNSLFEADLISSVKAESKILVKAINTFWTGKSEKLDSATLTVAIKDIEVNIVSKDTTPPVITLLGATSINIIKDTAYSDAGATAVDDIDGTLTVTSSGSVNSSAIGTYTMTYTAIDTSNNIATATRTVNVIPVVTSGGSEYPYLPKTINNKTALNFLSMTTFGANKESIEALKNKGIETWVNEQLALTYEADNHLRRTIKISQKVAPTENPEGVSAYIADNDTIFNSDGRTNVKTFQMTAWFQSVLFDENQLQHRVAYALSQIVVESLAEPAFIRRGEALASYFDILSKHALGNYKDLLLEMSYSSSMGLYLTYHGSKKQETTEGGAVIYPDENYAREIMQLFTIGLYELNLDGTVKTDTSGNTIPTYTQTDVNELAKVFTGWDLKRNSRFGSVVNRNGDYSHPLEFTAEHHDFSSKSVLGSTIQAGNEGAADIAAVIDILMAHPNIAPFISKQLIIRLVKSNPTPAYVARVATVFNDNGQGVKGDLKAVVKAILLDAEVWEIAGVKKFKEPLLAYTEFLRAFKVQKLPIWRVSKTGIDIENATYFVDPTKYLGQGAARAYSVFNFYNNNYIPNDATFKQAGLHAPELQIQTDNILIAFSNKVLNDLKNREKRYLLKRYGTLSDISVLLTKSNLFYYKGADKFLLDCQDEYAVMEEAIEGSSNGTFKSFNSVGRTDDTTADTNGETNRDRALKALITALDNKLVAGTLGTKKKDLLFNNYKELLYRNAIKNIDDPKIKIYEKIIMPIIMAIVTSENFMVQE